MSEDSQLQMRPSAFDPKDYEVMETPKRTSIIDFLKNSQNTEMELQAYKEKNEELETQMEHLESQLEEMRKEVLKWRKKYTETLKQEEVKIKEEPRDTIFDRVSELQELLT